MPQAKKYQPGDDSKVIGGRTVVFQTDRPQSMALLKRSAQVELARTTAAALKSAAQAGVPFCEDCERARRELEAAAASQPAKSGALQRLHLHLKDGDGQPLASRKYTLEVGGKKLGGTTSPDGLLDTLAPKAESGKLTIHGAEALELELRFAPVPPVSSMAGVQARLNALGYHAGSSGAMDDQTREAVREFQEHHLGLDAPSGELDETTRSELQAAYPG